MFKEKCAPFRSLLLATLTIFLIVSGAWGQTFKVLHAFGAMVTANGPKEARCLMAKEIFMELPKSVR